MNFRAAGATDIGKLREADEDAFLIDQERNLYIVADGMGGHQGGGYASQKALELIREELIKLEQVQDFTQPLQTLGERTITQARLLRAIQRCNQALFEISLKEPHLRGMGTTLTGIQFDEKFANIAHIGDSRAYQIRDGKIIQLTEDHSWVQEQVNLGILSQEEARNHPLKNIITRSIGHEREIKVDLGKTEYQVGDKYLLCSDGLTNMVKDEEILKLAQELDLEKAVARMIERANEEGGYDNITVILVEVLA
jgi:protein phosphatase